MGDHESNQGAKNEKGDRNRGWANLQATLLLLGLPVAGVLWQTSCRARAKRSMRAADGLLRMHALHFASSAITYAAR
jgi:hypothetical protein